MNCLPPCRLPLHHSIWGLLRYHTSWFFRFEIRISFLTVSSEHWLKRARTHNQWTTTIRIMAGHRDDRYHAQSSSEAISAEAEYAAHNYHPLPVVFARAQGASVWDPVSTWVPLCARSWPLLRPWFRKKTITWTSCPHTAP